MANLVDRAGSVKLRVGGKSQDTAVLVNEIPNGADLSKNETAISVPVSPHQATQAYITR